MSTTAASTDTLNESKTAGDGASSRQPRLESIDGLRGIACLMVLALHCWLISERPEWPRVKLGRLHLTLSHVLDYSYGGVDLFFMLSGFCLAYPILSRPERRVDWKKYFVNRIRRIVPTYWAALALFEVLGLIISHYHIDPFFSAHVLTLPNMRQLVYSIFLISVSLNMTFWTLCLEWRWYFVLPLMIVIWRKFRMGGVLAVAIAISAASVLLFRHDHFAKIAFLLTPLPTFLPLFALGIWGAKIAGQRPHSSWENWILNNRRVGLIISTLLLVAVAPEHPTNFYTDWDRVCGWGPFLFFMLLYAVHDDATRRVLSWKPLVAVGTFSYSLYLTHMPFVAATYCLTRRLPWSPAFRFLFYECVVFSLLVGFGYLFFLVAEKPFLRRPVKKAIEAELFGLKAAGAANTVE